MTCSTPSFPPVPASVVDSDPMDEVDIPQVYTIEDAPESELEAGKQLACKVHMLNTDTVYGERGIISYRVSLDSAGVGSVSCFGAISIRLHLYDSYEPISDCLC